MSIRITYKSNELSVDGLSIPTMSIDDIEHHTRLYGTSHKVFTIHLGESTFIGKRLALSLQFVSQCDRPSMDFSKYPKLGSSLADFLYHIITVLFLIFLPLIF